MNRQRIMESGKSIEITIILLVLLGAAEMLFFAWLVVQFYGPAMLYTSRTGRTILGMLLVVTGAVCYYLFLKITGQRSPEGERPAVYGREDPRNRALDIEMSYLRAFNLSKRSIESLSGGKIKSVDMARGIIEGWIGPDPSLVGAPMITITLEETREKKIHITLGCITSNPTHQIIPRLIDHYFSRNERCVNQLYDFINDPANQGDGTLFDEEEVQLPET